MHVSMGKQRQGGILSMWSLNSMLFLHKNDVFHLFLIFVVFLPPFLSISGSCVELTSSNSALCMLLGGRPVKSRKWKVHRTEYTRRAGTFFKASQSATKWLDAGNNSNMGCA